jgi:hypothetical protein
VEDTSRAKLSGQIPITVSTRFVYAGCFRDASRAAARANLSLREWAHLDFPGEPRVFELRDELPAIE